jgi:cell division topological specificity factor
VNFFDKLFRGRTERSSEIARDRLLKVLIDDRFKLTPEMMVQMKAELAEVVARYIPGAEADAIEVALVPGEGNDHLKADIPLRRSAS